MIDIKLVKKLREETKAGIADCKQVLEESNGNMDKAKELLKERGVLKAAKKGDRETTVGIVESYIHAGGKIGSLISLGCETDFVARTDEFKHLAREIAMQVAAMKPKDVEELTAQPYIRDQKMTIGDLIKQTIAKVGENIQVVQFTRQSF
ncbi:translation elongation factor Ts [Candidatus Roizmanbacteria bacterium RIFCSPLOWO2_01_FULL_45_11]|uniref:Elongation factor Ts n=1 Tax=Candidatus Roizmanbacteria bacterium RIFCSPLOWO2_01_FULL_45_11 TaxID=1802070 RepID=A0A1F7JEP9_9BACT|nr:MAG: translation elongation factor Ts [Candidatus Roizmanbacteria bacterium RIFCSPLOWO2_01_FULL_45_11]